MDVKPRPPVTPLVAQKSTTPVKREKPKYSPPAHLMVRPFEGLSALLQTR